jgi:DNA-binding NtrC family response regulator
MTELAARVLVVDDDPAIRRIVADRLRAAGHQVDTAADGRAALDKLQDDARDLMILDWKMPALDGFGVLAALAGQPGRPEVIMMTAHGSIDSAVRAVREGAADFIVKPFEAAHLEHVVRRVLESAGLSRKVLRLETELSARHALVLGDSEAMRRVAATARQAAQSQATVLLSGESGSGKEVLARFLHQQSPRHSGPFVAVNCAVLSANLLESELFGHEKGAFTGADAAKPGQFELAAGGTLLLDEIGDLALDLQAKLLRVLQEREFRRVGGTRTLTADIRLIAATHRDLAAAVQSGRFRQDLFYRLKVITLEVPPLRARLEDLPALAGHLIARSCREAGRPPLVLSPAAEQALLRYDWPGNVRELSNTVERAVVFAHGRTIELDDLPEEIRDQASSPPTQPPPAGQGEAGLPFHEAVRAAKRRIIAEALRETGGHQTRAAERLGLTQPYLSRLIKNLELR